MLREVYAFLCIILAFFLAFFRGHEKKFRAKTYQKIFFLVFLDILHGVGEI